MASIVCLSCMAEWMPGRRVGCKNGDSGWLYAYPAEIDIKAAAGVLFCNADGADKEGRNHRAGYYRSILIDKYPV